MNQTLAVIVAVVVVLLVVVVVVVAISSRRGRAQFQVRPLPPDEIGAREARIDEIERMFVNQPREAVAAARLLVDEMLTKMGYPVRLTAQERARDLRYNNRAHADRYSSAGGLKDDANTEEMRRALKGYLDTAREILAEAQARVGPRMPAMEPTPPLEEHHPVTEERTTVEERPTAVEERPEHPAT